MEEIPEVQSIVDVLDKDDVDASEVVVMDKEEVNQGDEDVEEMEDLSAKDFCFGESSQKKRRKLSRSDNLRKFIRRRSSVKVNEDELNADSTAVDDNHVNDLLEAKQVKDTQDMASLEEDTGIDDLSPTHDSLGRPISGFGPVISHVSLGDQDEVDNDGIMDDNSSEAGSENTDIGINDSITNMQLLRGYLFGLIVSLLSQLWGYADMGITYVYNNYLGVDGAETKAASPRGSESGMDEPDTDEAKQKQEEACRRRVFHICNELLTTEREYAKRLKVLSKIKVRTGSILQPEIARAMFQNIDVIQQFHQDNLLPQLEERITCWNDQQKIGDIMRKLVPFLKLYTEYVKNFQKANELFQQWRQKSNTFATFVEEAENNIEYGRLKVQAHMLEPVQRVPRYELLLKDYLKHLPQDSLDRHDAEQALKLVSGAAKHFEEMMKRDSRIVELMKLQPLFEGIVSIVSPDRELLHHGKCREVNSKAGKISDRILHLFNDMLLISSQQKYLVQDDKFRVKHEVPLKSVKVLYGNNLEVQYTFFIQTPETILEFSASSAGERKMWMTKITRAVQKLSKTVNSEEEISSTENETSVEDSQLSRRYTFQMSADLKVWRKRTVSLFENGLLTTSKTSHDKGTLATVHIINFHIGISTIPQKKSHALILVGDGRSYYMYDDSESVVESWFEALKNSRDRYQLDGEADTSADIGTTPFIRDSKSRMSTASTDSGIDAMSYTSRNSGTSFDSS